MAIAITYDAATNKIQVTGGTAETKAVMHDLTVADLAGEYELLAATGPAADLTLDNQIRPALLLALKITFTLSGTNAGAGDTLDITGTDAWDNADTESIDVSGGDDDYTTAKYWKTITDIDCTGFSDAVGTISAKQGQWGVIKEHVQNAVYEVEANVDFGNGSTGTYFESLLEQVYFADSCYPHIEAGGRLYIGEALGDYSANGSSWSFQSGSGADTRFSIHSNALAYIYGSRIDVRSGMWRGNGPFYLRDTVVTLNGVYFYTDKAANWRNVYVYKPSALEFRATLTGSDVTISAATSRYFATTNWGREITVIGAEMVEGAVPHVYATNNAYFTFVDPVTQPTNISINHATSWVRVRYTCNIHVAKADGTDAVGRTVLCEDQFGAEVFSVVTDGSGDIAEQTIDYKKWEGTDETLTEHSPHTFTLSKAGEPTVIVGPITVDHPIVWRLELPDVPAVGDVRLATEYADGSMTGTLAVAYGAGGVAGTVADRGITGTVVQHSISGTVA